jgi:hypothetical protein
VSNVAAHITAKIAQSEGTRQRNAPCVAGITRQIIKAASSTTTLSTETTHTEPPPDSSVPISIPAHNHTPTPHSLPQQQQCSYADVASNRAPSEEPITTLKAFLEDFKGLFAQLIHQNSLILNMLTTLLNNSH